MLFGSKKPNEEKVVPIEEVQKMTKKGMSDKDIIKHLKGKGYSYEAIEGAMLKAVKEGVDDDRPKVVERLETESPASENYFDVPGQNDFGQDFMTAPEAEMQEGDTPEVMLEELVEGIVEEKWNKFSDDLRKFDENIERMKAEIKQFDMKLEQTRKDSPVRDLDARMSGIADQLEDMEARVGGLEKAFKQFLPSLTRNIESLSHMIHEMKERQSVHEELE
jgi:archaellum component FlaC